jgi:hypothetical protein
MASRSPDSFAASASVDRVSGTATVRPHRERCSRGMPGLPARAIGITIRGMLKSGNIGPLHN